MDAKGKIVKSDVATITKVGKVIKNSATNSALFF